MRPAGQRVAVVMSVCAVILAVAVGIGFAVGQRSGVR